MQLYYAPNWVKESIFELEQSESHHIANVLRHRVGDVLAFTDGNGHAFKASIVQFSKKNLYLRYIETLDLPLNRSSLTLAVALTKSQDRYEWMIEKCCEIGVKSIIPIITERTERKSYSLERLNKIAQSACKQSKKTIFTKIEPITPLSQILNNDIGNKFVAAIGANTKLTVDNHQSSSIILIGPEGDFSPNEFKILNEHGFLPISLGQSILRVETAAIVAVALYQM